MNSQKMKLPDPDHLQSMQWCVLIVLCIALLGSLAMSVVLMLITKNLLSLAVPPTLALLMRPVIKYLFPTRKI